MAALDRAAGRRPAPAGSVSGSACDPGQDRSPPWFRLTARAARPASWAACPAFTSRTRSPDRTSLPGPGWLAMPPTSAAGWNTGQIPGLPEPGIARVRRSCQQRGRGQSRLRRGRQANPAQGLRQDQSDRPGPAEDAARRPRRRRQGEPGLYRPARGRRLADGRARWPVGQDGQEERERPGPDPGRDRRPAAARADGRRGAPGADGDGPALLQRGRGHGPQRADAGDPARRGPGSRRAQRRPAGRHPEGPGRAAEPGA